MITQAQIEGIRKQGNLRVARALSKVFGDIRNGVRIGELERFIADQDIDGMLAYLGIDEVAWQPLSEAIRDTYREGGEAATRQLGPIQTKDHSFRARFNIRNPRAEQWLVNNSSTKVVEIVQQQRDMLRDVLDAAMVRGDNPRTTALEIVGRVNQATRKREGGFIGLTRKQSRWVINARNELEIIHLQGEARRKAILAMGRYPDTFDPLGSHRWRALRDRRGGGPVRAAFDPLESYLSRALRDRRFDGAVRAAAESGKALNANTLNNAIARMQTRAERYRGTVIARTESLNALRAGQWEAIEQAVEGNELSNADTIKVWDASGDSRVREDHSEMDGQKRPVDEPFQFPDGSLGLYPGDSSLGAPANQTIQCRCKVRYEVDFFGRVMRAEGF